jgi:dolichyl-phosphate beta-glucosyltransferase
LAIPSSSSGSAHRRSEFLSVVIPAYNEATRLPATLRAVHEYLTNHFDRFEIVVVDDGSTDNTAGAAEAGGARLLRQPTNTGKGAAVRDGMLAGAGEIVLFSDADLSTPIEEVEKALDRLAQGWDVVIGSRALPDSDVQLHQNFVREYMGKAFNVFVRVLAGLPFRDTQCGFKCFTRRAAQTVFAQCVIDGFAFDVEALSVARRLGFRVTDMPVRWVNSPASRVNIWVHPWQMLGELLQIRWRHWRAGTGHSVSSGGAVGPSAPS